MIKSITGQRAQNRIKTSVNNYMEQICFIHSLLRSKVLSTTSKTYGSKILFMEKSSQNFYFMLCINVFRKCDHFQNKINNKIQLSTNHVVVRLVGRLFHLLFNKKSHALEIKGRRICIILYIAH